MLEHLQIDTYFLSISDNATDVAYAQQGLDFIMFDPLLEGKLAAAARGSKLSKKEGSCNSTICKIGQQADHYR